MCCTLNIIKDQNICAYFYYYFLLPVLLIKYNNFNLTQFAVFYVKQSHWCTQEESQQCFTPVLVKCQQHWHSPKVKSTCVLISWCWLHFWFISHSLDAFGFKEGRRRKLWILIKKTFLCEHSLWKKWKKSRFSGTHIESQHFKICLLNGKATNEYIYAGSGKKERKEDSALQKK